MSERKAVRFVVTADCSKSGGGQGTGKKPWRKQRVLVHQGDEVRALEFFLRDDEPFLEPGEYLLSPDAVYVGEKAYKRRDGSEATEPALCVAPRFVKRQTVAAAPRAAA